MSRRVLWLEQGAALVSPFCLRADHDHGNMAASVSGVAVERLVKHDDQQPAILEGGAGDQRADVLFQPVVGLSQRAIVRVIINVRHDEGIPWQGIVAQVVRELSEGDQIHFFHTAVAHVGEVGQRIVPLDIRSRVSSGVAGIRQAFSIGLPGFASGEEVTNDVIGSDRSGIGIIVGDHLARSQHEVVADGRMSVGIVAGGQAVVLRQAVEVRHGGAADDAAVAVVFLNYDERMIHYGNGGCAAADGDSQGCAAVSAGSVPGLNHNLVRSGAHADCLRDAGGGSVLPEHQVGVHVNVPSGDGVAGSGRAVNGDGGTGPRSLRGHRNGCQTRGDCEQQPRCGCK